MQELKSSPPTMHFENAILELFYFRSWRRRRKAALCRLFNNLLHNLIKMEINLIL